MERTFKITLLLFLASISITLFTISESLEKIAKQSTDRKERGEYKALYLKCNGQISRINERGKFDEQGNLK